MSELPKIEYPSYTVSIPSTKALVKFRPFLVKEEKILLMARESENPADMLSAIKQIVVNCCLDKKFDIDKLALFDLEYIFLKLRTFSVDNTVKVSYKDTEDGQVYEFEIDLNEIKVKFPENNDNVVKITPESGLILKYPPATLYDDEEYLNLEENHLFELIVRCVDKIYFKEEIYPATDYKKEQISTFLENLDIKTFEAIQKFLINSPKMHYEIKYKNSLGNNRSIVLSSLSDFFTWR